MLQSEKKLKARHREKNYFKRPRSTQDLIPVDTVYPDGMFLSNGNIYSKSYRFSDINYQIAGQAEKEGIIREMRALAKGCTPGEMSQITIVNRHINRELLERLQYTSAGDGLDGLRGEMNRILENQAGRGTGIIQERYFTTSVSKSTPREATIHFDRVGTELALGFANMGSKLTPIGLSDRLRILHDFYRPGDENYWHFDFEDKQRKKHSFKDSIAPMSFLPAPDYFKIGSRYVRVLAMTEYASWVYDGTVKELINLDTVEFEGPEIKTKATVNGEKEVDPLETITLTDTVTYRNLIPGKTYQVKGVLMDKGTGNKLLVDGKEVTAESIFIPEKPTGTVEMTFTFPASALAGKTIVVFESVYHEGKEVAVHADIEDEDQTIIIRRKGGLLIRKTSEDDFVEGISFIVAGEGYEETFVTDKQGQIYVQDLVPGEYTITEVENDVTAKYIIEAGKTVTIASGEEPAEVEFLNKLKRGSVYVVKTAEGAPDANLPGAEFAIYTDVDGNAEFDLKTRRHVFGWNLAKTRVLPQKN